MIDTTTLDMIHEALDAGHQTPPPALAQVLAHDDNARALWEELVAIEDAVTEVVTDGPVPSAGFAERVMARLDEVDARPRAERLASLPIGLAVAAVLAAFGVLSMLGGEAAIPPRPAPNRVAPVTPTIAVAPIALNLNMPTFEMPDVLERAPQEVANVRDRVTAAGLPFARKAADSVRLLQGWSTASKTGA